MKNKAWLIILISISCVFGQLNSDVIINQITGISSVFYTGNTFHVAWNEIINSETHVVYLMLDSTFNSISDTIRIPFSQSASQPHIVSQKNKVFFVWRELKSNFNSYIKGTIYDIEEKNFTTNIYYNNENPGDYERFNPRMQMLNDTLGVVVWYGYSTESIEYTNVFGQLFSTKNNLIGNNICLNENDAIINSYSKTVRCVPFSGKLLIVWIDNSSGNEEIYGKIVNSDLTPESSSFQISDCNNSTQIWSLEVAKSSNNSFFVVWSREDGNDWTIEGRWIDENGNELTEIYTMDNDSVIYASEAEVAINEYNQAVVVWEKNYKNYAKIFYQEFSSDMEKIGAPKRLSTNQLNENEYWPEVCFNKNKVYSFWLQSSKGMANVLDLNKTSLIADNESIYDQQIEVFNNYPNPFNSSTILKFYLKQISKNGSLKIYDIKGNIVFSKICYINNNYATITWIPNRNLSSGEYFAILKTENEVLKQKMLYLK